MAEIELSFNNNAEDNALSSDAVSRALCEAKYNPTEDDIKGFYSAYGKAEDDSLTLEEFQLLAESMGDPHEELRKAFRVVAGDDGVINREELKKILADMQVDDESLEDMINELIDTYDKNGDGNINIDEFVNAVNGEAIKINTTDDN